MDTDPSSEPSQAVCCCCGQPMLPGQPRWAGDPELRPWHYGCAEAEGLTEHVSTGVETRPRNDRAVP